MVRRNPLKPRDMVVSWLFVLPAVLFMAAFLLYPLLSALRISFSEYNFVYSEKPIFNGIDNYVPVSYTHLYQGYAGLDIARTNEELSMSYLKAKDIFAKYASQVGL